MYIPSCCAQIDWECVNPIKNYSCRNIPIQVPQLPSVLTFNLPLKWKKPVKMQYGVSAAHAVEVGGKVYIGGGGTEGECNVLEYTIQGGQWREIKTPVDYYFGMAVVNDQLIIIGGEDKNDKKVVITGQVWALGSDSNTWTQPFPPMPTARWYLSAVGYKRWVLVVGGDGERCVEVLDTASKKWYTAAPLPSDALRPSLAVIQDTLYVVWGKSAVSISIPILISDAISQSPASNEPWSTEWQLLPDTPTYYPAITSFYGSLLTVGTSYSPSSSIAMYLPQTEQWLTVAQLPTPRNACTCVVLPETRELMVVGGRNENEDYIKTIDICYLPSYLIHAC